MFSDYVIFSNEFNKVVDALKDRHETIINKKYSLILLMSLQRKKN